MNKSAAEYRILSALNDLQGSDIQEYLQNKLDNLKTQLVNCQEESSFRTLQGKAQQLSEILNSIYTAKDQMIELRKSKPSPSGMF